MKRATETYRGIYYFRRDQLMFINRIEESFLAPFHDHDFYEIVYIAEGEGFHHIGDSVQKVRSGQICYIPIGMSHVFRPTSTGSLPLIVNNCVFAPLLLSKLLAFSSDPDIISFLRRMESGELGYYSFHDRNDRIGKLFQSLYEQYTTPHPGAADYLHALLLQLIVELNDSNRLMEESSPPKEAAFQNLMHYLDTHFQEELTLSQLADLSGFSDRHLQRLFNRHTGQSWHRYLQTVRVQKSKELLRQTSDQIRTIAEAVGYKDIHSFNSVFKRATGLTPSQYRRDGSQ